MTTTSLEAHEVELARTAGTAAAGVLPAPEQVTSGAPEVGTEDATAGFAGAVVALLEGSFPGRIALLVGEDLVTALSSSPLGGLDLAAAVQPTLDAIAGALEARAGAARETDLRLVVSDLEGPFTVVPLVGAGVVAAVLLPDAVLRVASQPGGHPSGSEAQSAAEGHGVPKATDRAPSPVGRGIELLHGVDMEVTVEIGRTRMTVRDLLDLSPGAVLELDRAAGSPADLLVNGRLIARGEVVVVDEDFGLRVTEIVLDPAGG